MSFRNTLKWALIQALILIVGVLILELSFGSWFRSNNGLGSLPLLRDFHYSFDASKLYQSENPIRYQRDHFGLRGDYKNYAEIDILTLGGSTTDQRYISLESTFQETMERELKSKGLNVSTANAGMDGHSTVGHILAMENWIPNIPDLNPKFILVYAGLNDVNVGDDSRARFDNILKPEFTPKAFSRKIINTIRGNSAIYQAYTRIRGMFNANRILPIGSHKRRQRVAGEKWEVTAEPSIALDSSWQLRLDNYEKRVIKLIQDIKNLGAKPIFVTQLTATNRYEKGVRMQLHFPNSQGDNLGSDMLWHFNKIALKACEKQGGICLDLARKLTLSDLDFYDLVHTTPSGSIKIGKWIANNLAKDPRFIEILTR